MKGALDTDVAIETPEHIVFRYRIAGPARRALAYLIDMVACYSAVLFVGIVVALAALGAGDLVSKLDRSNSTTLGAGVGLVLLLLFVVQWVYFVVWETWKGTSLGKMALGLRVVTTTGRPVGFGGIAVRNVLRGADALPVAYLVGVASMIATTRFQRLGDLAAGTMVVLVDRARAATPLRLWPTAAPAELAWLPDVLHLDAEERHALELFLRRRGELGAAREGELAQMVLGALAARHTLTLPAAADPARLLALLHHRSTSAGRGEAPPSLRPGGPASWR